ncbi:MAG: sigma-70 family RNA polymerase sigma factor [Flavobacteriales bacterium]
MNQAAAHPILFEQIYNAQVPFFKKIIAKYFSSDEQADIQQEFAIHFFFLFEKKYEKDAALFDSKAWLRTVVTHYCISQLRRKKAQKNEVWVNTTTTAILKATENNLEREVLLLELLNHALGCVDKQEALILKMKYMYQKPSKEIEQKLGVQYVDVQISRIKAKIRKKLNRTDLHWL